MNRLLRGLVFSTGLMLAATAQAGPVADFEADLRAAYADYRSALFLTNANKGEQALKALDGFSAQWSALAGAEAPPQYADDPEFKATLEAVAATAAKARAEVASGALTEAHETLEGIRTEISGLHERNNIVGFSDRMNAYHAMMEHMLGADYAGAGAEGLAALREDAAVLSYLAADIAAHPAPDASEPDYAPLLEGMMASARTLQAAARAGDAAATGQALSGLKPAYSKFFLKFG